MVNISRRLCELARVNIESYTYDSKYVIMNKIN